MELVPTGSSEQNVLIGFDLISVFVGDLVIFKLKLSSSKLGTVRLIFWGRERGRMEERFCAIFPP